MKYLDISADDLGTDIPVDEISERAFAEAEQDLQHRDGGKWSNYKVDKTRKIVMHTFETECFGDMFHVTYFDVPIIEK